MAGSLSDSRPSGSPREKNVSFADEAGVRYITARALPQRSSVKMTDRRFQKFDSGDVTDDLLQQASQLFSRNYGVWGHEAGSSLSGTRVRLSKSRLRAQYLPRGTASFLVTATVDGVFAGHAFGSHWQSGDKKVCWITQLVIHQDYRGRSLATGLLANFLEDDIDVYGLMSSHAFACLAASKAFGRSIEKVDTDFIANHAKSIMASSPVQYVRDAKLRGTLFESSVSQGSTNHNDELICCVDAGFFVDHAEPLEALDFARKDYDWPLGELHEGHEFLVILEARRRARSRSISKDREDRRSGQGTEKIS